MQRLLIRAGAAGTAVTATLTASLVLAGPAAAEPPVEVSDPRASCVGQVFAPQGAYGEPGAIADRIAEIKGFIPVSFGAVIGDFARWEECDG